MLGIIAGWARVRLGGASGPVVELHAGDVVVIPAGVTHKREAASRDRLVVGAYPQGQNPGLQVPGVGRDKALRNVAAVPLPAADPIYGAAGPLVARWRASIGERMT